MINRLRALANKIKSLQEPMGTARREMEILRKNLKRNANLMCLTIPAIVKIHQKLDNLEITLH